MCNNIDMKKIAVFGGTFNPVHNEHVALVNQAISGLELDKIIITPTFTPPHKSTVPAPAEHRLNMLKRAFLGNEKVEISDFEIKNQGKSYTYLTVEHFKSLYPDSTLYFLVGGDMLTDFKTWRYPERILASCTLAVIARQDYFTDWEGEREYFKKTFGKEFVRLSYTGKECSSTKIRIYSALSLPISDQVPKQVEEYIKENEIYSQLEYADYIKKVLPEKRLKHTANVICQALKKVKELKLDEKKVITSALLHDLAKYQDKADYKDFDLPSGVPQAVEHAFLGAYIAEHVLGISDSEVIDAIKFHTSGKANMSTLTKLIFVADMIEEDRDYDGVEYLRQLYETDFEKCLVECLKEEVIHLKNKKQYIYHETLSAFEYYCK